MKTAFVTGGSGYVGRNLIRHLVSQGVAVRALGRSDASRRAVAAVGATPIAGDLDNRAALVDGCTQVDCVFHAAAKVDEWGPPEEFERINVRGTRNVLRACEETGASRLVHISTEAVLAGTGPLVNVDETSPIPARFAGEYSRTKALAERELAAARNTRVVIVRPRFVWGGDDTTLIPAFAEAVRDGRFSWIGPGTHQTSTCHIDNLIHALWLAGSHPTAHGCYFVTDGDPIAFREFLTEMMATQNIALPNKSVPRWLAGIVAGSSEWAWRTFDREGKPPVTRMVVTLLGGEVTVNDSKIRRELGYAETTSRSAGLQALRARHLEQAGL